jgi:DNA mismatch repair protein MutS
MAPPPVDQQLTPMMQQYRRIKHQIPGDALLLFRLGDFYEMFFDDAQSGALLLNLALTHRNGVPMCGVPHHAAETYIGKLLRLGRKVAICDQLEEARPGKLVNRDVTQVLSPGTHFDAHILHAGRNNFLAAMCPALDSRTGNTTFGLALLDLTTGDFRVTELSTTEQLYNELARVRPAEIIVPTEWCGEAKKLLGSRQPFGITPYDDWTFERETAFSTLRDHFKTQSLDGFGAGELTVGIGAAGAALHYLQQSLRRNTSHIHSLKVYGVTDYMVLDATTQRNLELLEPGRIYPDSGASGWAIKHTLIGCLDRTLTPMGARLLREWLTHPLKNVEQIEARQSVIATFCAEPAVLTGFREQLRAVRDMERMLARLSVGTGNARDLVALKDSQATLPLVKTTLQSLMEGSASARPPANDAAKQELRQESRVLLGLGPPDLLATLASQITELPDLVELILRAIADGPPMALKDGGIIKQGFNAGLDELRSAATEGKTWIAALQQKEIKRTGITSLKVRYNQVFGYYIEVTKANLSKVPADYIRKQTIATGERFYTPELKEMEGKILGAEDKAKALEYELFLQVRDAVVQHSAQIQQSAAALAALDVLAGFAELARHQNYCCPTVNDGDRIDIVDGRHPVLEQTLIEERFVPNDSLLDGTEQQILIITGPNMAGKSTYIRQVALLVLMAQVGSYIPAARATIGLVDRIFTRIGATDDLARGQSTFLVEMNETANILNNATARSLVVLDEIGRGTSTFDGLSIAWAVAEHLHNVVGAKTLFATHYHELTELAATLPRVKNYNVAVREWHDKVIFLHKILPGGTDKSYGIQVARLAGLPKEVVARAKEVLANLEEAEISADGQPKIAKTERRRTDGNGAQEGGGEHDNRAKESPPQMYLFNEKPPTQ